MLLSKKLRVIISNNIADNKTMKESKKYQTRLKEKQAQIDILRNISETISYNWDLGQVLGSIIAIVSRYMKSDSCFIYLIDGSDIILRASQNPHKEALGKVIMRVGEGITGWVAQHGQSAVLSSKAYLDKRFKFFEILPEDKYEAFLSVPIIFKDKTVGVINVQHIKKTEYDKDKVAFLEIIAKQVGGAIENARLAGETDLLKEALETRKLVEKAKGILMKNYGASEAEAHELLTKKSMDKRKPIKEIAQAIILSNEIIKQ